MQEIDTNKEYFTSMFSSAVNDLCNNDDFEMELKERKPFTFKEFKDVNLRDLENYRRVTGGITFQIEDETFKVLGNFKEIQVHIASYYETLYGESPILALPFSNVWVNCLNIKSYNPYLLDFKMYSLPINDRLSYVNRIRYCNVITKKKTGVKQVKTVKEPTNRYNTKSVKYPKAYELMFEEVKPEVLWMALERCLWINIRTSSFATQMLFTPILYQEGNYYYKNKSTGHWVNFDEVSLESISSASGSKYTWDLTYHKQLLAV